MQDYKVMKNQVDEELDFEDLGIIEIDDEEWNEDYFEVSDSEVKQSKLMYESRKNEVKTNAKKSVTQIERLSETIEQELSAKKFLEENNFYNFIGKTNKNNLVFEYKNKQVRISEEGLLL